MPSLADADFAACEDLLAEVFGVAITVTRGTDTCTIAEARVADHDVQAADSDGAAYLEVGSRTYLIRRDDYAPGGSASSPAEGDLITEIVAGESRTQAVLPASGEGRFADADPGGEWLIVHTKRVA
jgi:hypothetical protein